MKIKGYTNGYYDMFHIGHLNLIRKAAAMCDQLIVGVISDEECLKNKGQLPVIPLKDRLEIVGNIKGVSIAVPVYKDDKFDEWQAHGFNILFVGSDHKDTPLWIENEKKLSRYDVDVIYLPYTQGISSSEIRKKIKVENV